MNIISNEYYKLGDLLIKVKRNEDGSASISKFNRDTREFEDGSAYWAKVSLGRDDDLEVLEEDEFRYQMTIKKIKPNWRESEAAKQAVEEVSKWPQWKKDAASARFSIKPKKD